MSTEKLKKLMTLPPTKKVPSVEVKISYEDRSISLKGAQFIDAIAFICDVERAFRLGLGLPDGEPTYEDTSERISCNRNQLFGPQQIDV